MNFSGGVLIATTEARTACKGEPDIIERVKKAMRACHHHWMETNESEQLRAAIAGAILESEGEEKDRLERSARALSQLASALSAAQNGVPVDWENMELPAEDIVPFRKLWDETKPKR